METIDKYDWQKEWLNKPFHRKIYGYDGKKVDSVGLELIQIKPNECVLLVRRKYRQKRPYLNDEKIYEGVAKSVFVGYNCRSTLIAFQEHLSLDGQRIGCNGLRKNFLLNRLEARVNFGLSGVIAAKNEGYSECKKLPKIDTFGEFCGDFDF